ncbi:MAG TPA: hypothetical protein PLA53_00935 [bacterium]|jgi:hypothetical protein|nr:hypothetical protein [bacterium]HNZ51429.1 hypothetical protein [bacterium]HOF79390.1 hypothetical protein [bacterium]HOH85586.1 hypothetical protein [bacterium]HOQ91487.1 hypothetical protein [bacterium]
MKKSLYLLGLVAAITLVGGVNGFIPQAEAGTQCFIRFNVLDSKIYSLETVETILLKANLINRGDLTGSTQQERRMPFDSKVGDSQVVNETLDNLQINLCGKVDGCDTRTLDMEVICELSTSPTGNTIRDAQLAYRSRITEMNACQQGFFKKIRALNSQYVRDVRAANVQYYQQLAPRTAALLKSYRAADDKDKRAILDEYITHNQILRRDLYTTQTIIFETFINSRTALQNNFNFCGS